MLLILQHLTKLQGDSNLGDLLQCAQLTKNVTFLVISNGPKVAADSMTFGSNINPGVNWGSRPPAEPSPNPHQLLDSWT